jgi:hypothetical protein
MINGKYLFSLLFICLFEIADRSAKTMRILDPFRFSEKRQDRGHSSDVARGGPIPMAPKQVRTWIATLSLRILLWAALERIAQSSSPLHHEIEVFFLILFMKVVFLFNSTKRFNIRSFMLVTLRPRRARTSLNEHVHNHSLEFVSSVTLRPVSTRFRTTRVPA